ncbi:MAG: 30S ribosomal protein S20 [Elusimicrobiota bacterium]
MAKLKTGRHTSAMKESRKAHKREARNKSVKSTLHTLIKKIEDASAKKEVSALKDLLSLVFSELDKAAKRKVIHLNKASNLKARLSKIAAAVSGQPKK